MIQGTIIRVAGPVVDVKFTEGKLPALQEALTVTAEGTERTMEVAQHVDETTVRCIMLSASEGLGKGMTVQATGHGLSVVPSLVRVQLTDELLDALELAMNEEVPLLDSNAPEPTALRVLTQDRLATQATFSAPRGSDQGGNQGGEAIERSFSLQWVPVALPDAENPEHAQKMLIALAVENPTEGEPAQVEAQLLPVATPLELKRLLTD